jgi:bacteriocin biosynthesis cyclodehydratase domain-containing protein
MRPTLLPNLRRLWRDSQTLQIGSDPSQALVIQLARPDAARVLDLLDGSSTAPGLLDGAFELGIEEPDVRDLLDTLRHAGLVLGAHELTPAGMPEGVRRRLTSEAAAIALRLRSAKTDPPRTLTSATNRPAALAHSSRTLTSATNRPAALAHSSRTLTPAELLRQRAAALVLVTGDGPLIAPVAAALAAAGVGHIDPALDGLTRAGDLLVGGLSAEDVRQPRAIAIAAAIDRAAPGTNFSPVRAGSAPFVVHFGGRYPAALATRGLRLRSLPRLEVGIRQGTVTIGPLIRPYASPCRECLDLHRRDRDPAWPVLKAQLATAPPSEDEPCAHTTALAGAAYAAEEVLAFLDGAEIRTEAAIVEITRPGEANRRNWASHPRCDCRRRRRAMNAG